MWDNKDLLIILIIVTGCTLTSIFEWLWMNHAICGHKKYLRFLLIYSYTFVTKRKALKHVYFENNLAKTWTIGRVIFSLAKAPAHVAPLQAQWCGIGNDCANWVTGFGREHHQSITLISFPCHVLTAGKHSIANGWYTIYTQREKRRKNKNFIITSIYCKAVGFSYEHNSLGNLFSCETTMSDG
jgi:hypothetical protein